MSKVGGRIPRSSVVGARVFGLKTPQKSCERVALEC